jgi:phospholipid transport system substrate-binding protein
MRRAFVLVFGLLLSFIVASADSEAPDQLVRKVSDQIIKLIKQNKDEYTRDPKKLYAMVDREVLPYFDFRVMSRSVLGRFWRDASDDQRERFVKEFRELLVRTYATALLKYTNQEVRVLPFRAAPEDKTVLVRTEIAQGSGAPNIAMNYSFYRSDEGWKVYDVAIEGVSLVTNYRSVYAEKARAQGLDALIASIADANRRGQVDPAATGQKPSAKAQ